MESDGRMNIVSKCAAWDSYLAVVALTLENKWTEVQQYMPSYFLPPQDIPGSLNMVTDTRPQQHKWSCDQFGFSSVLFLLTISGRGDNNDDSDDYDDDDDGSDDDDNDVCVREVLRK